MTVGERALKVKYNLWLKYGVKRGLITEEDLHHAIYLTGLSKKSRGLKAVTSYLMDYRHLGKSGGYYYVIYVKKEQASPKDIIVKKGTMDSKITHVIPPGICANDSKLYPYLMESLLHEFQVKNLADSLRSKEGCYIIKFQRGI